MNKKTESILEQAGLKNPKDRALVEAVAAESNSRGFAILSIAGLVFGLAGVVVSLGVRSENAAVRSELAATSARLAESQALIATQGSALESAVSRLEAAAKSADEISRINGAIAQDMIQAISAGNAALRDGNEALRQASVIQFNASSGSEPKPEGRQPDAK